MKKTRLITAIVLICILLTALTVSVGAKEEEHLSMLSATIVSDTEIVLEFSEPVAINKIDFNRGPFCALRYVNDSGAVGYDLDEYGVSTNPLQWSGELCYIGEDRTKLLWTMNDTDFGVKNINDVINCVNEDVQRSVATNNLSLRFVLEEVPYDTYMPGSDGKIDNVTTEDGSKHLYPDIPRGWESCMVPVDTDYDYKLDRNKITSVNAKPQDWDFDVIFKGEGLTEQESAPVQEVETVVKNDPLVIALIFAADIIIAAVAVVLVIVLRKKNKRKAA